MFCFFHIFLQMQENQHEYSHNQGMGGVSVGVQVLADFTKAVELKQSLYTNADVIPNKVIFKNMFIIFGVFALISYVFRILPPAYEMQALTPLKYNQTDILEVRGINPFSRWIKIYLMANDTQSQQMDYIQNVQIYALRSIQQDGQKVKQIEIKETMLSKQTSNQENRAIKKYQKIIEENPRIKGGRFDEQRQKQKMLKQQAKSKAKKDGDDKTEATITVDQQLDTPLNLQSEDIAKEEHQEISKEVIKYYLGDLHVLSEVAYRIKVNKPAKIYTQEEKIDENKDKKNRRLQQQAQISQQNIQLPVQPVEQTPKQQLQTTEIPENINPIQNQEINKESGEPSQNIAEPSLNGTEDNKQQSNQPKQENQQQVVNKQQNPQQIEEQQKSEEEQKNQQQMIQRQEQQKNKKQQEQRIQREEQQRIQRQQEQRLKKEQQQRIKKQEQERLRKEQQQRAKQEEQERLKKEQMQRIERQEQQRLQRQQSERFQRQQNQRLKREQEERIFLLKKQAYEESTNIRIQVQYLSNFSTLLELIIRYISILIIIYIAADNPGSPPFITAILIIQANPLIFIEVSYPNIMSWFLGCFCRSVYIFYIVGWIWFYDRGFEIRPTSKERKILKVLALYETSQPIKQQEEQEQQCDRDSAILWIKISLVTILFIFNVLRLLHIDLVPIYETLIIGIIFAIVVKSLWHIYVNLNKQNHRTLSLCASSLFFIFCWALFRYWHRNSGWMNLMGYIILQSYGIYMLYMLGRYKYQFVAKKQPIK